MKVLLFSLICLLLAPFTSSCRSTLTPPTFDIVQVTPATRKQLVSSSYKESIRIDGVLYIVPEQWRGKKVAAQPLTFTDVARIPKEFTHNESKLYLCKDAAAALELMAQQAALENISLQVDSAYRSVRYQRIIFKKLLAKGRSFDDIVRFTAPPGYSQHALGTVVDFYPSNWNFSKTEAYHWLKNNAAKYNFVESYPEHQPEGNPWEAWHWRWIPESER